jgi:predicted alpha/beta hydrolase
MQPIQFKAKDGYTLKGIWITPVSTSLGTVILNSATGVKKEYYLKFAHYLVQQGYRVLVYDYRGIGASAPVTLKGFTATMQDWGILDMNAALNYVVQEKNAAAVIWVGHSIGGQLMGLLEHRHKIKKVLAINCSTGYWRYFTFPYNFITLFLWICVGPLLTSVYGYAPLKKIGWGESLPRGVFLEWRKWCLTKKHFATFLQKQIGASVFSDFNKPIIAIYTDDDYIANSKTVKKILEFYPNAPQHTICIKRAAYSIKAIGHTAIFKSIFQHNLWPILLAAIEQSDASAKTLT